MANRFTPNDVIHDIKMDDYMVDLIGFVDEVKGKHLTLNWQTRSISNMEQIYPNIGKNSRIKNILEVEDGVSKYVSTQARYNYGNDGFQLEIKDHTSIKELGMYGQSNTVATIIQVDFNDILHFILEQFVLQES